MRIWFAGICAAAVVGTIAGLLAAGVGQPKPPRNPSAVHYGPREYPHYFNEKVTEAEMLESAKFPVLLPYVPEKWHLVEVRQIPGDELIPPIQGFLLYYDTSPTTKIESASVMVLEQQTLRTPEMEKAFVDRLRTLGIEGLSIETIAGCDVVFYDRAYGYFMRDGVLYAVSGRTDDLRDLVRDMIVSMVKKGKE